MKRKLFTRVFGKENKEESWTLSSLGDHKNAPTADTGGVYFKRSRVKCCFIPTGKPLFPLGSASHNCLGSVLIVVIFPWQPGDSNDPCASSFFCLPLVICKFFQHHCKRASFFLLIIFLAFAALCDSVEWRETGKQGEKNGGRCNKQPQVRTDTRAACTWHTWSSMVKHFEGFFVGPDSSGWRQIKSLI